MPFEIVRADITRLPVDAIVNAANTQLRQGGGVCGAIFSAAGEEQMRAACEPLAPIETGQAVMTPGFGLPARYVIHTAGPVWQGGQAGEEELLRQCYVNSMRLATQAGLQSIAFPLLSSGIYGYPKDKALGVALSAISVYLQQHDLHVTLAVFSKAAFQLSQGLFDAVTAYVSDHYVDERERLESRRRQRDWDDIPVDADRSLPLNSPAPSPSKPAKSKRFPFPLPRIRDTQPIPILEQAVSPQEALEDIELGETFTDMLLRIIRERDLEEPDVYKRANMDRKLFHKIRSNRHYQPSRKTALALAVALRLSTAEAESLMACAGYALSPGSLFDVIIRFFLDKQQYDILEINTTLFYFDQDILA